MPDHQHTFHCPFGFVCSVLFSLAFSIRPIICGRTFFITLFGALPPGRAGTRSSSPEPTALAQRRLAGRGVGYCAETIGSAETIDA